VFRESGNNVEPREGQPVKNFNKEKTMTKLSLKKFMIAPVLGAVLLAACSTTTNPIPANTSNIPTCVKDSKGFYSCTGGPKSMGTGMGGLGGGMGMGGMMGEVVGGFADSGSSEKSYGVITFERPNEFRFRSVIDGTGTSFSSTRTFSYYTGSQPIEGGFFGTPSGCFPQVSYLPVGVSGTVRFTRKNGELLARVVLRTRSGKIVPDTSKRPENACSKEFPKIEKAENVSEKILTKLVPVIPGKDIRVEMGKTIVTVSLDKDFPVDRIPAYPAFTSPEGGEFGGGMGGGMMGGVVGKLGG
jgi:hypothetical protein